MAKKYLVTLIKNIAGTEVSEFYTVLCSTFGRTRIVVAS